MCSCGGGLRGISGSVGLALRLRRGLRARWRRRIWLGRLWRWWRRRRRGGTRRRATGWDVGHLHVGEGVRNNLDLSAHELFPVPTLTHNRLVRFANGDERLTVVRRSAHLEELDDKL